MKLASLRDGSRDGRVVIVSRDNRRYLAPTQVRTLQAALDDWEIVTPHLLEIASRLEDDATVGEPFREADALAPLPRAYQWADGSAYVNHVALVRRARGAEVPDSFWTDPLMYQGGSDAFLASHDPIANLADAWGIDCEAEIAVITGDVPLGANISAAARAIRLVMLCNDISLRNLIPGELAKGFGFFQSKPPSAFSPLAVTPDELGLAWDGARLHLPVRVSLNAVPFGAPNAGVDMTFGFPELIAHAAKTRPLAAGTIIGSGTISNRDRDGGPGRPMSDGGAGYACIAEQRTVELLTLGRSVTPFLRDGDTVHIEMVGQDRHSIFGAICQRVVVPA